MCERAKPNIEDCLEKGLDLSSWFAERILNPESMCDWKQGNCGNLFGEGAGGGAAPPA